MDDHNSLQQKVPLVFEFAARQLRRLVENTPGFFPTFTVQGKWQRQVEGWTNWCEGLWVVGQEMQTVM